MRTEKECFDRMLFGSLPDWFEKVSQVRRGDTGFLLNLDSDKLYGIFRAESDGQLNIEPTAWGGRFPAQVRVMWEKQFKPVEIAKSTLRELGIIHARYVLTPDESLAVRRLFSCVRGIAMLAHEYYDKDAQRLMVLLKGKGKDSATDFEWAITTLMHLCGLRVEWIGYRGLDIRSNLPDIVAFSSDSQAILGECKTNVFDDKEIREIAMRAKQLGEELKMTVIATIFTSLSSEHVGVTAFQLAEQEGVKIVDYEDLDHLLQTYADGKSSTDLMSYIREISHSGRV